MPKLAGQQLTQKLYKIAFFSEKNAVSHVTFAGQPTMSYGDFVYALFIIELFCTYNQIIFVINNINKIFNQIWWTACIKLNIVTVCVVLMLFNKLKLMQVSRGNILKTTGMLCNPNFVHIRIISILVWALYISSLPLTSLPKMVKPEMPASVKQSKLFVLVTMCWSSFVFWDQLKGHAC